MRLSDRPTGDLLILLIAVTVCVSVLAAGAGITYVRIAHPDVDVSRATAALVGMINTLVGMLAGYIAGRSDARSP